MVDPKTQAKLDQLEKIQANNRARAKRYLDKIKADGRQQISAVISNKTYNILCRIRDRSVQSSDPLSFGSILESALSCYIGTLDQDKVVKNNVNIDAKINTAKITPKQNPVKPQAEISAPVETDLMPEDNLPDRESNKEAYQVCILDKIIEMEHSGMTHTEIRDKFNSNGILTVRGKSWTLPSMQVFCKRQMEKRDVKK